MKVEKRSVINCCVQSLFDFHCDENNLSRITPPSIKMTMSNMRLTDKGQKVIDMKIKRWFITTHWQIKIIKMQEPHIMIDMALKSPFSSWEHHHIFNDLGHNQCELYDCIEYHLPLGFLGQIASFIIRYDIGCMLDYRHKKTKAYLER